MCNAYQRQPHEFSASMDRWCVHHRLSFHLHRHRPNRSQSHIIRPNHYHVSPFHPVNDLTLDDLHLANHPVWCWREKKCSNIDCLQNCWGFSYQQNKINPGSISTHNSFYSPFPLSPFFEVQLGFFFWFQNRFFGKIQVL